jgi:signal transduction histidine kinase
MPSQSLAARSGQHAEVLGTGEVVAENYIIIPGKPCKASARPASNEDKRVRDALGEISAMIAGGRPLADIIERTLTAISELFGIEAMFLEIVRVEAVPSLRWVTFGFPKESAEKIIANMGADYYPKDLLGRTMADKFRVTKDSYYVPAEDWIKMVEEDPFSDHPSYYRHPENVRLPRKAPDEWHEADHYRLAMRGMGGELLATLELDYSCDGKLLSKEIIELVELFTELLSFALMREMRNTPGPVTPSAAAAHRTDLLEDILSIASSIVSERDLRKLSDMILTSVSSLFGFGKVSLVVYDEFEALFKWMAVFGYGEDIAKEVRLRTIPIDVILEDLREEKRIGKSAYMTPIEAVGPHAKSYFIAPTVPEPTGKLGPRKKDEFRVGDYLAFALHDSAGRIVGVLYPTDPKEGKVPSKETIETIEIFTSLAEVAIENARLSHEREMALRVTSQRTEQLSRILDLVSGIMYVRDLDQMLDNLLKTLARLVGTKRMVLGIKDRELGVYKIEALHGYSQKAAEQIKRHVYPVEFVDTLSESGVPAAGGPYSRWWTKMGRMSYYSPAESLETLATDELAYYPDPELIRIPRAGKGRWHELDYIDTLIFDREGVPLAYLETLKPRDDRIPDQDTIEVIEIFASLAGIAIENAKMFEEHIESRKDSELYTDVLSHDVKNFNQAILGYVELLRMKTSQPDQLALLDKVGEQVMNTSWLASNVRTMSRMTFGDVDLAKIDLGAVLLECQRSISQYYPGRKVVCKSNADKGLYYIEADELVREVFINILTNAVKYDLHEPVEIGINIERMSVDDKKVLTISIADHGCGVSDETKPIIFDRFSKAPKKGSGMGLHIVMTLSKRYRGRVWVEDRVKGDHTQGAVFKIQLPSLEPPLS